MASTATAFIDNIDTTFPVPGVDNDTQGFRDNYITIKSGLTALANEVTGLMINPLAQVTSLNTLTQLEVSGVATISQLIVNGLDITPDAGGSFNLNTLTATTLTSENVVTPKVTLTPSGSGTTDGIVTLVDKRVLLENIESITLSDESVSVTTQLQSWGGNAGPLYDSTLTLASVAGIAVGYKFKLFSTETTTHSVLTINTLTNTITTDPFDPRTIPNSVTAGSDVVFTKANFVGIYAGRAPVNLKGAPGDKKGMFFGDDTYQYVCVQDYAGDNADIWKYYPNATGFCKFVSAPPNTSKGGPGDKKGHIYANSGYIFVCVADYVAGVEDIWCRSATSLSWS